MPRRIHKSRQGGPPPRDTRPVLVSDHAVKRYWLRHDAGVDSKTAVWRLTRRVRFANHREPSYNGCYRYVCGDLILVVDESHPDYRRVVTVVGRWLGKKHWFFMPPRVHTAIKTKAGGIHVARHV